MNSLNTNFGTNTIELVELFLDITQQTVEYLFSENNNTTDIPITESIHLSSIRNKEELVFCLLEKFKYYNIETEYQLEMKEDLMDTFGQDSYIIKLEDKYAGTVNYNKSSNKGETIFLRELFINEELRYIGIGKHIIKYLQNKHNKITLYCKEELISYYENLGFVQNKDIKDIIDLNCMVYNK